MLYEATGNYYYYPLKINTPLSLQTTVVQGPHNKYQGATFGTRSLRVLPLRWVVESHQLPSTKYVESNEVLLYSKCIYYIDGEK